MDGEFSGGGAVIGAVGGWAAARVTVRHVEPEVYFANEQTFL